MSSQAASASLHVVLVRCNEPAGRVLNQLRDLPNTEFTIMQKHTLRCNLHQLPSPLPPNGAMRQIPRNLGRECSGYLQFLYDEYDRLPPLTAFLQWNAEMHMPMPIAFSLRALLNFTGGFVALSKNSFEGIWPAPCEPPDQAKALTTCASHYWQLATQPASITGIDGSLSSPLPSRAAPAVATPTRFRFYANGLFAVSRERVRAHPRSLYKLLLDRMLGREALACVGGVHRPFASWANSTGLVRAEADCLMLEKMWHVFFGEDPTLAPPEIYNEMRFPKAYRDKYAPGRSVRAGRIECTDQKAMHAGQVRERGDRGAAHGHSASRTAPGNLGVTSIYS